MEGTWDFDLEEGGVRDMLLHGKDENCLWASGCLIISSD